MPGLVQASAESTVQATLSSVADDRLLGAGQHHRLIIRPDAFHVSVLFQPTLAFLDRVSDVLPAGVDSARESSTVLDDFVLKVYLPQLEEKVSYLFHQAVTGTLMLYAAAVNLIWPVFAGPEAFQPDPSSSRLSPEPLVKVRHQPLLFNPLTDHYSGKHSSDGVDQFVVRNADQIAFSSRKLLAFDSWRDDPVLPEV
jgi:exocyst complex component 4